MPTLDFWFDFASTYSYPAAMRIGPLAAEAGVTVRYRPFLLGPIFKAQGWDTSPFNVYEAKGRHMWRDLERLCADLALPFRRPEPFPQSSLLPARVALVGLSESWGEAFCQAVFRAEFAEGRRIDDAAVIGGILDGLKLRSADDPRRGADRRQQATASSADRRSAAARHLRRADLHHQRRRTVLGQRPAGTRAAMGARRRLGRFRHPAASATRPWPCAPWPGARCIRRSGRSTPPARRWRGRRGCLRPDDRDCRRRRTR